MQEETCLKFSQAEGTLWLSQTRAVGGEGCRARCSSIFLGAAAFLPRHYGADVLRGGPSSPPLSKPGLSSDLSQIFCGRRHGTLSVLASSRMAIHLPSTLSRWFSPTLSESRVLSSRAALPSRRPPKRFGLSKLS